MVQDPLVKLYLMVNGKRVKKKKTESRKATTNPVWNQALTFTVPSPKLHSCTLEVSSQLCVSIIVHYLLYLHYADVNGCWSSPGRNRSPITSNQLGLEQSNEDHWIAVIGKGIHIWWGPFAALWRAVKQWKAIPDGWQHSKGTNDENNLPKSVTRSLCMSSFSMLPPANKKNYLLFHLKLAPMPKNGASNTFTHLIIIGNNELIQSIF